MANGKRQMANGKAPLSRLRPRFSLYCFPFHICLVLLLTGCGAPNARGIQNTGYFGPTESMEQVVQAINRNNNKLPTLFASLDSFEAHIVDDRGKAIDEVFGGQVLYRSPRELRVVGTKALGAVVEIGSNNLDYW